HGAEPAGDGQGADVPADRRHRARHARLGQDRAGRQAVPAHRAAAGARAGATEEVARARRAGGGQVSAAARIGAAMRRPCLGLLLSFAAFAAPALAQDELGLGKMWTFERPPLAYLEREYGLRTDEAWWNRMRLALLRFGRGCSASFVSPQGLILTNHHCARGA